MPHSLLIRISTCFCKLWRKISLNFQRIAIIKDILKLKMVQKFLILVITRLLNYTIDLDLINQLSFSLKILGDFHLECFESDKSFFYYNEGRKCGHLIGQQNLMAECLIQMAICASRSNLYADSIRLLKKALEYIWYYDLTSLQLKVYD